MPASPHKASTSFASWQNNPRPIPRAGRPQLHLPLSSLPTLLVSGTLSPQGLCSALCWDAAPSPQPSCSSLVPGLRFSVQSLVTSQPISIPSVTAAGPSCSPLRSCLLSAQPSTFH